MSEIQSPEDVNEAIRMLPPEQHPYHASCPVSRDIQSIFFHYDLSYGAFGILSENGFTRRKMIVRADPDGDDEQRCSAPG